MNKPIRIAVIEDNRAYARSIREIIASTDDMQWVSEYPNSECCLQAFQEPSPPDVNVILLDLGLPGKSGITLIPTLRKACPHAAILVLTSDDNYRTVLEVIQLGVAGYILKNTPVADMRRAIRDVHEGGSVIDTQLSRLVLNSFRASESDCDDNPLSNRERQVLELLAIGYVKKEIAAELSISYSAVALYTANIYEKLQVPNVAAAVGAAIRKRLI